MIKEPKKKSVKEDGFTLIELLVAMTISLVVMGSIYSVYHSQQKSYLVQEQVSMMQQNLRAGMTIMTADIRMAGYVHPSVAENAAITVADDSELGFTRLKDDLTLPLQEIKYYLSNDNLFRSVGDVGGTPGTSALAHNIDALNFVYLDMNGSVVADPNNNLSSIKAVQVTMVARTGRPDPGYNDSTVYMNQQDEPILAAQNDSHRRRILSREIRCRNLL